MCVREREFVCVCVCAADHMLRHVRRSIAADHVLRRFPCVTVRQVSLSLKLKNLLGPVTRVEKKRRSVRHGKPKTLEGSNQGGPYTLTPVNSYRGNQRHLMNWLCVSTVCLFWLKYSGARIVRGAAHVRLCGRGSQTHSSVRMRGGPKP